MFSRQQSRSFGSCMDGVCVVASAVLLPPTAASALAEQLRLLTPQFHKFV